jgi:hypothetical protein
MDLTGSEESECIIKASGIDVIDHSFIPLVLHLAIRTEHNEKEPGLKVRIEGQISRRERPALFDRCRS